MGILWTLIIGAVAGWLAGLIYKGSGSGLIINIILGIVGSFVGSFVFGLLGLEAGGGYGSFIVSIIGAIIVLWLYNLLARNK